MSKKDYIEIAAVLHNETEFHLENESPSMAHAVSIVAEQLADLFERGNELFDRSKFMRAALPAEVR